jgi:phage/plasmid-like protein (TIGR03299 family)
MTTDVTGTNRRAPWQVISDKHTFEGTSARQIMREAGLNWTVSLEDVFATSNRDDFGLLNIPNRFATVRTNQDNTQSALAVVGSRYKVLQNEEVFSSLDFLVDSGEARYASAGELAGGAVVWTVMELPNSVVISNDPHAGYLLVRTSHDGSNAFQIAPIISRLSCTNQMNAAFADASRKNGLYSLKHTMNSKIDIAEIRKVINLTYKDFDTYSDMASALIAKPFSDMEFKNFSNRVFPMASKIEFSNDELLSAAEKRTRAAVMRNRNNAWAVWTNKTGTQENLSGTKFGALHAIIEVADHFSRSDEKTSSKVLLSKDGKYKQRALELLGA